ncbi:MAG: hypothetical protein KDL87_16580, partial [Verrucomicrobiae bacterium]|nr:hypothetical protein [Verrucomicrobiae bacterium]
MKNKRNLLGKGESLFAKEPWKPRTVSSTQVYTIDQAKERLLPMLRRATSASAVVREESCYSGKRTMAMRIHPSRISKSAMPSDTFKSFELEILGSRGVEFVPDRSSKSRPPGADMDSLVEESVELFVAGAQGSWEQLEQFAEGLSADDAERSGIEEKLADEFLSFEEIRFLTPEEKNGTTSDGNSKEVEILLQQGDDPWGVIDHFTRFARLVGFEIEDDRIIDVAGLFFIPVTVTEEQIDAISRYSHVRFIRNAAELRVFNPVTGIRGVINRAIQLPSDDKMSNDFRVAIFDGGLPDERFAAWVDHFDQTTSDPQTTTTSASAEHGAAVTSAFLFGHMDDGANETPCPPCRVDHYRVIADGDHDPYVVLRRITSVLKSRSYRLVNLSLGPEYAIVDDHIDPWTASLDSFASSGDCFIAVAAGNEGEADQEAGNHRIQPPSDGVNVI